MQFKEKFILRQKFLNPYILVFMVCIFYYLVEDLSYARIAIFCIKINIFAFISHTFLKYIYTIFINISYFYSVRKDPERERSHLLFPSSNAPSSQGWARSKSGARNSFWVLSHEWQGSKYLSHRLLPPRMHISWKLDEQRSWSWNHNIDTGCRHAKWQLTLLCHTSSNLQF